MEIVGGVAAIVELVKLTVYIGAACQKFYIGVKDARNDIRRLTDEITSLADILQQIQDILDAGPSDSDTATLSNFLSQRDGDGDGHNGPLANCHTELQALYEKLESASSGRFRTLRWPFREKEFTKLLDGIERQKSALHLALTVNNTTIGVSIQDDIRELRNTVDAAQASENREKVLNWLTVTDPSSNYVAALSRREKDTGAWFLEGSKFDDWKHDPNSVIWLYGKAGCGKTVLCSTIIEHLQSHCTSDPYTALAYFYFDFSDIEKQSTRNFLKSLTVQLCRQRRSLPEPIQYLHQKCLDGNLSPTLEDLKSILLISTGSFAHVYLVIDALDECPPGDGERETLLSLLREINSWSRDEIHLLVTSRREVDIDEICLELLTKPTQTPVSLQDDLQNNDIRLHISKQLMTSKFKNWPKKLKDEVELALTKEVDGMFRWVACQLDLLQSLSQASKIRRALKSLPKSLDATYDRMLLTIDDDCREQAFIALQWLAFSARPLSVAELAEAIVIDPREDPPFDAEDRLFNPTQILRFLPGLVTISSPEWSYDGKNEIKFSHSSVKEYLLSSRIHNGPAKEFSIASSIANVRIAETCLSYHLTASKDHPYNSMSLLDYPLAAYAATYWAFHARQIDPPDWSEELDRLCAELFGDTSTPLLNLIRIADPDREEWKTADYGKVQEDLASKLYYAAASGVPQAVQLLLDRGADVNARSGRYCTALNVASRGGHDTVVGLLLERNARVNEPTPCGCPLQSALSQGHEKVVRALLDSGADTTSIGSTFQVALDNNFSAVIELLAEKGIKAPLQPDQNQMLLIASKDGREDLVRDLLDRGANVNVENGTDGNPLQMAAEAGHVNVVRSLIRKGATVNHTGEYYYGTALQGASRYGHEEVVRLLLESGADTNVMAGEYGCALQAAARGGHDGIVTLLLDCGARIDARGGRYGTALAAASRTGQESTVRLLLGRGAAIDVPVSEGRYSSALDAAQHDGNKRVVKLLTDSMTSPIVGI